MREGLVGRRGFRGWKCGGVGARGVRCGLESFAVLSCVRGLDFVGCL